MSENIPLRRAIAEELLGQSLSAEGYALCPGRELHSGKGGSRDFRIILTDAPTAFCFHHSCAGVVDAFNKELRTRIAKAERQPGENRPSPLGQTVARKPEAKARPKRPPYEPKRLEAFAAKCPVDVTPDWLLSRSPFPIPADAAGGDLAMMFLNALYEPGEKILVFTRNFSQGDFLFHVGDGSYRLAEKPNVRAVHSPLPDGGPEGVWFLVQPVTGLWSPNHNNKGKAGAPKLGRRHGDCVTAWRFLVLESDDAPEELWLRALVQLPLPVVAIYTSGGRSVHALVRVSCGSKAEFDLIRDDAVQILAPLGADAAAMTAVRLSRLPGMMRHGSRGKDGKVKAYPEPRLQRLLWLNPQAENKAIIQLARP